MEPLINFKYTIAWSHKFQRNVVTPLLFCSCLLRCSSVFFFAGSLSVAVNFIALQSCKWLEWINVHAKYFIIVSARLCTYFSIAAISIILDLWPCTPQFNSFAHPSKFMWLVFGVIAWRAKKETMCFISIMFRESDSMEFIGRTQGHGSVCVTVIHLAFAAYQKEFTVKLPLTSRSEIIVCLKFIKTRRKNERCHVCSRSAFNGALTHKKWLS